MSGDPWYHTPQWKALRLKVLRRDAYRCTFCGELLLGKARGGKSPVVDHIITRKEAPHLALELGNLRVLCQPCDNRRHIEKSRGEVPRTIGEDGFYVE